MNETENIITQIPEHHIQKELCTSRPQYRQGKKLTAVKVYTVNDESQHVLFYGVPALNLSNELKSLCLKYGELHNFEIITKYNVEEFTECYHANFKRIQSARIAKRFLDNHSFYGGLLHVCYAPEYETLNDLRNKLQQRRKDVLSRMQPGPTQLEYVNSQPAENIPKDRKRKNPAIPITDKRLKYEDNEAVWKNVPKELDPRLPDSNTNYKSVGLKKHFKMPNIKRDSIVYGPFPSAELNTGETSQINQPTVKMIPSNSNIIKAKPKEYNKTIIFKRDYRNK